MLKNTLRYAVLCAILIIISHMLTLSQCATWEAPTRVLDSMLNLSSLLQFAMAVEIAYFIPALLSFGFVAVFAGGNEVKLFSYHVEILSSADILGSIIAVMWSALLVAMRGIDRKRK